MKIFFSTIAICLTISLFASQRSIQNNIILQEDSSESESTTRNCLHCDSYDIHFLGQSCTPQKIRDTGIIFLETGLAVKTLEFMLAGCLFPDNTVAETCKTLWFPTCVGCCNNVGDCCGTTFDIAGTTAVGLGCCMCITGHIWGRMKKDNPLVMQELDTTNNPTEN